MFKKEYHLEVPIEGKIHILRTDLICNSCGKELNDGDYLYFCMKEKDDLCSSYSCLKKHAGHRFFRWGKIEMGLSEAVGSSTISTTSLPKAPLSQPVLSRPPSPPTLGVPVTPAAAPPAPPIQAPLIRTGPDSLRVLRTDMLKELKRLRKVMEEE